MAELGVRDLMAVLARLAPWCFYEIDDIARSIGVDASQLKEGLETLSTCGVAPYGPDDCLPLLVQGDRLYVTGELPGVNGPVRLSAPEARAIAAALQAAGFSAEDDLTRRLLQAAATITFDATELERTVRATTSGHSPDVFEALSQAAATAAVVRILYTRAGTTEMTEREIEPVALYAERGAWYVTAWCRRADDWRTFRVDRIASAGLTGERFKMRSTDWDAVGLSGPSERFTGSRMATLRFRDPAAFNERDWPGANVTGEDEDGSLLVEVPYGNPDWIARRVTARFGTVVVLAPQEVRAAVAALATSMLTEALPDAGTEPSGDLG